MSGPDNTAAAGHPREVANQVWAPVPVPDYANGDHRASCERGCRRAGTPATTASAGTSRVTTAPAPTTARSPIVTPHMMTAPLPIDAPLRTRVGTTFQSASV